MALVSDYNATLVNIFWLIVGLYVAPEIYRDEMFGRSVDVYSFAIIVYEVSCFLDF